MHTQSHNIKSNLIEGMTPIEQKNDLDKRLDPNKPMLIFMGITIAQDDRGKVAMILAREGQRTVWHINPHGESVHSIENDGLVSQLAYQRDILSESIKPKILTRNELKQIATIASKNLLKDQKKIDTKYIIHRPEIFNILQNTH